MKTPTKPASIVFVFLVMLTAAKANPFLKDTSKNDNVAINTDGIATGPKTNIVYPPILTGHESQTIEYIHRFSINKRDYVLRTFSKGRKYFPKITEIFSKYNLPHEFKVLIALESGFNGNARSRAGAVGYWQIMAPVAREYGLKIVEKRSPKAKKNTKKTRRVIVIDERKNFNKSTYAAARYLKDRCRDLDNDYLLIVASYNWGIGNVWNAMQRTGKSAPTFWDIKKYMPAETRAYVMNFIALNVIFHNYEKFAMNKLNFQESENEDILCEEEDECSALMGPAPHIESYF